MPKENELEGPQDQGGKHGGQKGMPRPAERPRSDSGSGQGIVRDQHGEEQSRDKGTCATCEPTGPRRRSSR
jgi:hypothetical protein